MGYIASGEGVQTMSALGCGGNGRCGPCAARGLGNYSLAEWYEEDDEPDPPAMPQATVNQRGGATMGEVPQRLVLQPPSLLPRDPTPPWRRRLQGALSRDLPPLTLRPEFQPRPGAVIPPPPPRPIDLTLPPQYQRELWERWERERHNHELTRPPAAPPPRRSLGQTVRRYLDTNLDRLLSELRIPRSIRGPIRDAARDAIGRGATELLDRALTGAGVGGEAREAITNSVRAAMEQIRVQ